MENSPVNSLPPFQCWPEKSLASLYKTIAVATKIISHLSNIEKGEGGVGCAFWAIIPIIMSLIVVLWCNDYIRIE